MKKRLLFVNESLACAGGEKSLLNLLSALDYSRYEVDLQLISYGNDWERMIPKEVNLLPQLPYISQLGTSLMKDIMRVRKFSDIKRCVARLRYAASLRFRKNLRIAEVACEYWRLHAGNIPESNKAYDVAIGYAQGLPTFYVADKVRASKKLCWVNAFYDVFPEFDSFVNSRYRKMDKIVAVADTTRNHLEKHFASMAGKITVFPDLLNDVLVREMSEEPAETIKESGVLTIVTLGRLEWNTKGLDLLLETAKKLNDKGLNFRWFILGEGDARERMQNYISANSLTERVILMGVRSNPYPVLKQADIYVQTSRNEGYGIAIAEARFLHIPIVSTHFETADVQLKHEINSLLTDFSSESIASAIERLANDSTLYSSIKKELIDNSHGNLERLEDFYKLII